MTNSVMTSDLALNELQSTERHFGTEPNAKLTTNDFNSNQIESNDSHLLSTTTGCGQHVLSPIGSANSCLSDDDNEPKRLTNCDDRNGHRRARTDPNANGGQHSTRRSDSCARTIGRVLIDDRTLMSLNAQELRHHWTEQQSYIDNIESQLRQLSRDKSDLISLRESEEKLKQQQLEANRRENVLVMRLTTKEQELQDYLNQIQELKQSQMPTTGQLQTTLIDPAINLMFEKMKKEVDSSRAKVDEMQNELSAWKFTPDSTTGKRLMAKCRLLYQENEELGKMIESGRIAKLEGELALHKNFSEELKKSQSEIDEFLLELDEDVEGMQNTIYYLQQQLKEAKDKLAQYEANSDTNANRTLTQQLIRSDNKCVHNSMTNSSDNNERTTMTTMTTFERTLNERNSDQQNVAEGVHTSDQTKDNCKSVANNLVKSTKEFEQKTNSTEISEQLNKSVVNEDNNSLKDNYLSVNRTDRTTDRRVNDIDIDSNLNNNCDRSQDQHMSSEEDEEDDHFGEPVVKAAKLSDSQTNAIDFSLKSSDSLTLNNNRIEVNGQLNQ